MVMPRATQNRMKDHTTLRGISRGEHLSLARPLTSQSSVDEEPESPKNFPGGQLRVGVGVRVGDRVGGGWG